MKSALFTFALRALLLLCVCVSSVIVSTAYAQTDGDLEDDTDIASADDPVKLFERAQDAHARGQLQRAVQLYTQALKLRPEFPEAELQLAKAFISLERLPDAEQALRRALKSRANWDVAHAALGIVLSLEAKNAEAEAALRRAVALGNKDAATFAALAEIRHRAGDKAGALEMIKRATVLDAESAATWIARARIERETGANQDALTSLNRANALEPDDQITLLERAEIKLDLNDRAGALADLNRIRARLSQNRPAQSQANGEGADGADTKPDAPLDQRATLQLASLLLRAGERTTAQTVFDRLDTTTKQTAEAKALQTALSNDASSTTVASNEPLDVPALERLITREPRNARALAALGAHYRTTDATRSLEYFRRANEIDPQNPDYATGFAAALVQLRRFAEAVQVLRRIIAVVPEDYAAHANLATALDAMKQYREAVAEYEWIRNKRPEIAITEFLIGRAYDLLGEYASALAHYETFLQRADKVANRLDIERVNLRLPTLRNQIKRGEDRKRKD